MDLPPFPPQCPIDNIAVVFDQSTLEKKDFEALAGSLPVYCTRQFLDKYDLKFYNLLHAIFSQKHQLVRELQGMPFSPEKYKRTMSLVSKIGNASLRTVTKEELQRRFRFSQYFHIGKGNVIDLDDEDDLLAARTNAYLSAIQPLSRFIPKQFVEQLQEEYLSPLTVQQVEARYIQLLNEVDPLRKINPEARAELYEHIRYQYTQNPHSTPEGVEEDTGLVALACGLPAQRVMLYSRDKDIKDLTLLTDCLIGTPHPIIVISQRDEHKYKQK